MINVGIREQLLVNVGAGLALTGMRPIVHTFGSFLVERAFEQVKLGFGHQDVGGVLVGCGRLVRHRRAAAAPTRRPGDVALIDTLPGVDDPRARRRRTRSTRCCGARSPATGCTTCGSSSRPTRESFPRAPGASTSYAAGPGATVVALGPMLDTVLAGDRGARRDRALRPHGAAVRRARRCAARAGHARRRARRAVAGRHVGARGRRRAARRTAPAAGARRRAGRSCAATAPRPSTSAPTAWTPPASARSLDGFLVACGLRGVAHGRGGCLGLRGTRGCVPR